MNQALRNWYLTTLGIVQYVPKGSVPVAAAQSAKAVEATGSGVEPPRRSHPKVVVDLGVPEVAEPKVVEAAELKSASAQNDSPDSVQLEQIQFRLACWQPTDDLLVIDSLTPGEQPGQERVQLLANILKAINRLPENGLSQAELIDWPVTKGGPADQEGARTLLSTFLDARIKQRGVCWVILMGETAANYIGEEGAEFSTGQQSTGQQRELSGGAKAIQVQSLQTMLTDPATKADTWQAIQFLADD